MAADEDWLNKTAEDLKAQLDPSVHPAYYTGSREQYVITFTDHAGRKEVRKYSEIALATKDYERQRLSMLGGESIELDRYTHARVARASKSPRTP